MDILGDKELQEHTDNLLALLEEARWKLCKAEVVYFGRKRKTVGMLFKSYANMVLNRDIDLFDASTFPLQSDRIPSACIIAQRVMETHAVGMHAYDEVEKMLDSQSTHRR